VIELLCGYLWRTDVPGLLKEYMFLLLAQAVRILHYCQGHGATSLSKLSPRFSPTQGIFQAIIKELKVSRPVNSTTPWDQTKGSECYLEG
jgi:E3 ubiquitin-protein ligase HECTD4